MLPGFRFLFAAIVLSMSILIFGLGAAALLRAAHEQFASIPTRRPVPETLFAQQPNEASKPVLAMLSIEAQPAAPNVLDKASAAETPAEPAAVASAPAEPERIAAPQPEPSSPPQTIAKPEVPVAEAPAPGDAAPVATAAPAAVPETRIATSAETSTATNPALPVQTTSPAQPEPAANPEQTAAPLQAEQAFSPAPAPVPASEEASATPVAPKPDAAQTKIATLGGGSITVEKPTPAKADSADPESRVKKRQQAKKAAAAKRRKLAARPRVVRPAAQQSLDPFGQPAFTTVTTTARTR
jgi:hypothetical protein